MYLLFLTWSVFQKNILKNELVVSSKIPPKKNPQKTVGFDVLILTNFYCLIPQKKWGPSASPLDPFTSGGAPPGGAPALAGGSPPGGPWKRVGGGNLMGSVEKFYTPKWKDNSNIRVSGDVPSYLLFWIDFIRVNVGKYTSPMDPMGMNPANCPGF